MTREPNVIEQAMLGVLARQPGGEHLYAHPYSTLVIAAGWAVCDSTDTMHLTAAGWDALPSARQATIWSRAVTEHVLRQGPIDAPGIRRLVLEHASAEAAFRRLAAAGHPAAASAVLDEATLIKARLAVAVGVPVGRMDEEAVMLRAEELATLLDQRTEADYGNPAAVDPRGRWERQGLPAPGDPYLNPWQQTAREWLAALLIS